LPVSESWEDDRGSKLLGFYEQELRPFIEAVIEWKPDVVLNVGCAEGYYAIGMAKRILGAKIFAYDVDPLAQAACKTARDLNQSKQAETPFATQLPPAGLKTTSGSLCLSAGRSECTGCT